MTLAQLQILQHSLGADQYGGWPKGHDWYYRDYFIGEDPVCEELVSLGFMNKFPGNTATGGDVCYRVTGNGIVAMRDASPKPPKISQAKQRFAEYREFSDAYDCSFRQWLDIRKTDWYKEMHV